MPSNFYPERKYRQKRTKTNKKRTKNELKMNGNYLENDFNPPPLLLILYMDIIDRLAAALGPLVCPSRSARPRNCCI